MSYTPASTDRAAAIVSALRAGETSETVAKRWGLSRARVHRILQGAWPRRLQLTMKDLRRIGQAADEAGLGAALQILFSDRGDHMELIDPGDAALAELNPRWVSALTLKPNRWVSAAPVFSCLARDGQQIKQLTIERDG